MKTILFIFVLLTSVATWAAEQCPNLNGTYFFERQEGKAIVTITQHECTEIYLEVTTIENDGTVKPQPPQTLIMDGVERVFSSQLKAAFVYEGQTIVQTGKISTSKASYKLESVTQLNEDGDLVVDAKVKGFAGIVLKRFHEVGIRQP